MDVPVVVRPIENKNGTCLFPALRTFVEKKHVMQDFERQSAVVGCDDHGANGVCDALLWRETPARVPARFICFAHKEKKVGECVIDALINERRGLTYTLLAFGFCRHLEHDQRWYEEAYP